MNQREYDEAFRELVYNAVVVPVVILLGMYIVGAFLASFLSIPNPFPELFTAIGGVPAVGYHFYRLWTNHLGG
jgi:hypothetical protein